MCGYLSVCSTDLQFKDHVEHAIRAIGLQKLHDMGVFQHVADTGLSLQVWHREIETGRMVRHYSHSTISASLQRTYSAVTGCVRSILSKVL